MEFALKAKPIRRYIPKNRFQYRVWWLVTTQPFEYAIFALIVLNTVTLAMKVQSIPVIFTCFHIPYLISSRLRIITCNRVILQFDGQPRAYSELLDWLNIIFTSVFALESVLKIMAFRFKVSFFLVSHLVLSFVWITLSSFRIILVTPGTHSTSSSCWEALSTLFIQP